MKYNSTQKRVFSSLLLSAGFVLFPSLALASYQPGQTLDPACPPSDGTCVVVPSTSQWTTSGSNIYFNTGNVGIGTTSPGSALSVQGNTLLSGNTSLGGTLKDLQGTPQSLFNSWAPRLWELADGTSLNPVTTSGATFKISRTEAVASTTC